MRTFSSRTIVIVAPTLTRAFVAIVCLFVVSYLARAAAPDESQDANSQSSEITDVPCAPELRQVDGWINTEPLTLRELRGKVVVVHFWAFGCINCIRNLPHYQAWYERFPPKQVTIVGIHTPETESERSLDNLRRKVEEYKIAYPVAFDAKSENWKAWANNMWPSVYLIDKQGHVRQWWYGELNWQGAKGEESMRSKIQELIDEK
jgi:thiol-disulfide isomerase/thioredoxin